MSKKFLDTLEPNRTVSLTRLSLLRRGGYSSLQRNSLGAFNCLTWLESSDAHTVMYVQNYVINNGCGFFPKFVAPSAVFFFCPLCGQPTAVTSFSGSPGHSPEHPPFLYLRSAPVQTGHKWAGCSQWVTCVRLGLINSCCVVAVSLCISATFLSYL